MKRAQVTVRGERFLALRAAADCYELEASFLVEVYREGLLGEGVEIEGEPAIAAAMLDRVAEIRRLHRHLGLDLDAIEVWLRAREG